MYRVDPGRSTIGGIVGPTAVSAPLAAADWASPAGWPDLGVGWGAGEAQVPPGMVCQLH